ncbi:MAG: tripartite tricarboxylate transporter substrate binding protein [Burkholderiales bacterium]|jgi:tripartite-type tricarboxylate transporter receptor subunit TctC|nr:tripartite tricarboxylate transporter substrate binding protein [Burkholderiales bacterium]
MHRCTPQRRSPFPAAGLLGAFIACMLPALPASVSAAAGYPERPLRFVIPFPSGGVSDIIGRSIAARLGESLKQTVIVDNRVGAGGTIGSDVVSKATPDGYTLLLGSLSTHAIAPHVFRKLPYDPVTGFAPVGTVVVAPNLVGASMKLDVRSVKDVITLAKAKPGSLSYASSGIGAVFHLSGELFNLLAGIDTVHVPFKGLAAAYPEVASGQIGLVYDSVISAMPHIKAGRIRPLAMLGARRSALLPDVPTMAEAGVPGYDVTFWQALFAPAGTPAPIIARLNDEVNRSLKLPEVRDAFAAQGAEVFPGSPAQLAVLLKNDIALMGKLVRQAKVQPD